MKYCKECGEQCGDDAKFCGKCGAKFVEKKQSEKEPAEAKPTTKKTADKRAAATNKKPAAKKTATIKGLTFQEKKDAIFNMTPQDNCGECGCKNCMQFAMQAASPKNNMELSDCPYIDEDEIEGFNNSLESTEVIKPTAKKTVAKKPAATNGYLDNLLGLNVFSEMLKNLNKD